MAATDPLPVDLITPTSSRATRVRYGVLAFLCSLAFLLYIDRNCISMASKDIEQAMGISHTEMGFVFGAFLVAYGLFEVITGRWGDRFGSRGVLLRIVLWWSAFTALTGCVWNFTLDSGLGIPLPWSDYEVPILLNGFMVLLLVRFLFGAGEAGALPNAARIVSRWFPASERGGAQGLVSTATLVAATVTPVATGYLIHEAGWRLTFVLYGALGLIWVAFFFAWYHDDPDSHPLVNDSERRWITGGRLAEQSREPHPPVPWRRVLSSRSVWLLGVVITCSAFFSYLFYTWYPTYLREGRGVSPITSGWLSSLVMAGGAIGCVLGGYLHDGLVRRTGNRYWTRRLIAFSGLSGAAVALLTSLLFSSPVAAALVTALASMCSLMVLPTWWASVTDISGKHVGAIFGLLNSMGVPGAFASPVFFGWFADSMGELGYVGRERLDPALFVYAGVLLLGAVGWLFIDPTRSVVGELESEDRGSRIVSSNVKLQ
jgi:MFS family permease